MPARKRQQGQALVFITVTAVIVLLVTLATFNIGQLSYHRIKLQNTADATAYTAAVAQARQLNFTAYMNRGVIANQVQVAQVVSLTGWVRSINDTYNNFWSTFANTLANFSPLSAMWTVPTNVIAPIAKTLNSGVDSAAGPVTLGLNGLIFALGAASEAYHVGFLLDMATSTMPKVIEANEPQASLSTFGTVALPVSMIRAGLFTTRVDPSAPNADGEDRMARVTQASTDFFYKGRIPAPGGVPIPIPIWPVPFLFDPTRFVNPGFGPIFMIRFHSGGGSLKSGGGTGVHVKGWSSLDATGLMAIMSLTLNILGIPIPIPFPLFLPAGSGAAQAGHSNWNSSNGLMPTNNIEHRNSSNSGEESFARVQYGAAHYNPLTAASAWIQTGTGPGKNLDSSSRAGIQPYREVKGNVGTAASKQATLAASNHNRNDVAPPWIIELERGNSDLTTSTTGGYRIGGTADGQLALPMATVGNQIRAMARAEAYFSRPSDVALFKRSDNKTEWGSTYSPYWQARLQASGLLEQGLSILGTWGDGSML